MAGSVSSVIEGTTAAVLSVAMKNAGPSERYDPARDVWTGTPRRRGPRSTTSGLPSAKAVAASDGFTSTKVVVSPSLLASAEATSRSIPACLPASVPPNGGYDEIDAYLEGLAASLIAAGRPWARASPTAPRCIPPDRGGRQQQGARGNEPARASASGPSYCPIPSAIVGAPARLTWSLTPHSHTGASA